MFLWNLKVGVFYLDEFSNISELKDAVTEYIDYYNSRRISLKLKGLSQLNIEPRPMCLVFNCPTFGVSTTRGLYASHIQSSLLPA